MSLIVIISLIISSIVYLFIDDALMIGNLEFYLYIILLIQDLYKRKGITLIQIWIIAYLYIINSEALLFPENFQDSDIWAVRFVGICNNCVLLGYYIKRTVRPLTSDEVSTTLKLSKNAKVTYFIFIILLLTLYIAQNLSTALIARNYGREYASEMAGSSSFNLVGSIIGSCGYILPAIIAYYFSRRGSKFKILYAALLSSPIFLILFWNGSRFPLLFSFLGFLIAGNMVAVRKLNKKSIIIGCCALLILKGIGDLMKLQRVHGASHTQIEEEAGPSYDLLSQQLSKDFSTEGVVYMTNFSHQYFSYHPHMMGVSTGFLLYFWIPRVVWPDKPAMLGYWLLRTNGDSGFASGHSVSFGFCGDFYADFGMFAPILCILLGMLLKILDNYCWKAFSYNKFNSVFAAMLYPWTFFIVRSPQTGTIALFGMSIIYLLFRHILRQTQIKTPKRTYALN